MKRLLFAIFFALLVTPIVAGIHTFPASSVLREGKFVKIRVEQSGIHSLTYEQIEKMGINPQKVCIFGYGGAILNQSFKQKDSKIDDLPMVPILMNKGSDGVFGRGDNLLFYAQGPVSWHLDKQKAFLFHKRNPYSNYGYYFVGENEDASRFIKEFATDISGKTATDMDFCVRTDLHEQELVNLVDVNGINGGGREFFGESFKPKSSQQFSFTTPNIITSTQATIRYELAAASHDNSSSFTVSAQNQTQQHTIFTLTDFYMQGKNVVAQLAFTPSATQQNVSISFSNVDATAKGWLNFIELNYRQHLSMVGDEMQFYNITNVENDAIHAYRLQNANENTQIWDVSRLDTIVQVPATRSGNTLIFYGSTKKVRHYVAFNTNYSKFPTPTVIGTIPNQNLHALSDVEMVIVTPAAFVQQAEELAKIHRKNDGLNTVVVRDEQIFNEFSSGTPDATAIRWFAKMLYERGNGSLKYLLLFGDGTFDNRNILKKNPENTLITYQINDLEGQNYLNEMHAFPIDDYFGCLGDETGIDANETYQDKMATIDIAVGRLPISTVQEANEMVEKIRNYITECRLGEWKNQVVFLADDGDKAVHLNVAERAAKGVETQNRQLVVNKIYFDAYQQQTNASNESYPMAESLLNEFLTEGMLFFDYSGHGGYNNITSENILSIYDIRNLKNRNLGFWMLATCSFSHFDSRHQSAGEVAVLSPKGGAIGVLSACRTVLASFNSDINYYVCTNLLGDMSKNISFGEATRQAKNQCGVEHNKLAYVLLCDPALKFNYPNNYTIQTTLQQDTLRALSLHTIEGDIVNQAGEKATDFNGKLDISIYDKKQTLLSNDNDERDESEKVRIAYDDYPNLLYKGVVDVEKGHFSFPFRVPKDIHYNYGDGRMVLYAYDTLYCQDAMGYNEDFTIGGTDPNAIEDITGPQIRLYLDHENFQDGDGTNNNPVFYAHITDENGINISGSGIGHNGMLMLDQSVDAIYYLNHKHYTPIDANGGIITYPLSDLAEGKHTLSFRIWDLANNSTTKNLHFEVFKGYVPDDFSLLIYPNPVKLSENVYFRLAINQPEYVTNMDIWVYDISGKLYWHHSQETYGNIQWSLKNGAMGAGIYIYNVQFFVNGTKIVRKGKIIVN